MRVVPGETASTRTISYSSLSSSEAEGSASARLIDAARAGVRASTNSDPSELSGTSWSSRWSAQQRRASSVSNVGTSAPSEPV